MSRLPASYFLPQNSQKSSNLDPRPEPGHVLGTLVKNSSDSLFPHPKGLDQAGVCRPHLSLEVSEPPFVPSGSLDSSKPHEDPPQVVPKYRVPDNSAHLAERGQHLESEAEGWRKPLDVPIDSGSPVSPGGQVTLLIVVIIIALGKGAAYRRGNGVPTWPDGPNLNPIGGVLQGYCRTHGVEVSGSG